METTSKALKSPQILNDIDRMLEIAANAVASSLSPLRDSDISPRGYRLATMKMMNACYVLRSLEHIKGSISCMCDTAIKNEIQHHLSQLTSKGTPNLPDCISFAQGTLVLCLSFLMEKYFTE